jgi:predicted TIM-barrel fold metal-dependent hydrolase
MTSNNYLINEDNTPQIAAFPVIDAHNHQWDNLHSDRLIRTMDTVGIIAFCNTTGNARIKLSEGGYVVDKVDISEFFRNHAGIHSNRFYCFTMSSFASPANEPLFNSPEKFVDECIQTLYQHQNQGAKGLKVLKELGLHFRDSKGKLINTDDESLTPIWDEAGKLGMPVLIHQADPSGFFEPADENNEHYESLIKYPSWSFEDQKFPGKLDLLKRRDNLIRSHPGTTFILPHFANFPENISYVSSLLDKNPNVFIDFSARIDELGRQPYSARDFFIRHQDRIIFGSDMPANLETSVKMYRTYFRFLETYDEAFYAPDYDGTFNRSRWPISGIGLPNDVLEKIYYKNILKLIPSLEEDLKDHLPE